MKICLITIGSEVLSGKILDSNFAYIASKLEEDGYEVTSHLCVPDTRDVMVKMLSEAIQQYDLLILTGGLGPTLDDLTKPILLEIFHDKLVFNKEVHQELERRYGSNHPAILGQADVPSKAKLLINELGTAPGLVFNEGKQLLIAMPGVPQEMYQMFDRHAMKWVHQCFTSKPFLKESLHFCLIHEYMVDPHLRELDRKFPDVQKGIYPRYGTLSVEFKIHRSAPHAEKQLAGCVADLEKRFETYLFSREDKNIFLAVHRLLEEKKMSLMLAESCTGGQIGAKLTHYAGASQYFWGSVVAYHNTIKEKLLGVQKKTLEKNGAVSAETAAEMASGVLSRSDVDIAAAVTGIAGPSGGSLEKPVGTVFFSLVTRGKPVLTHKMIVRAYLKREVVIDYASNYVVAALWRYVRHGIFEFK